MNLQELYERGLALRRKLFGDAAVDRRMNALGEFGEPLQNIVNAYAYGDVWSRPALPLKTKSLVMLGITAASDVPVHRREIYDSVSAANRSAAADEALGTLVQQMRRQMLTTSPSRG